MPDRAVSSQIGYCHGSISFAIANAAKLKVTPVLLMSGLSQTGREQSPALH